jgi:Tfp pilus assembly protein PilX
MTILSTAAITLVVALLVVTVVTAVLAFGSAGQFVVSNRRTRLARHQSIRNYYGGFALTH